MSSYEEKFKGQADHLSGHPDSVRTEKSIKSEMQDLPMKITAPANETSLNKAVGHLNRETQRGEHAPVIGGYKYDHTMR